MRLAPCSVLVWQASPSSLLACAEEGQAKVMFRNAVRDDLNGGELPRHKEQLYHGHKGCMAPKPEGSL